MIRKKPAALSLKRTALLTLALATDLVLNGACAAQPTQASDLEKTAVRRLPDNTIPSRYDLQLAPDLDKSTFSGNETIVFTINKSGQAGRQSGRQAKHTILLHALDLQIDQVKLTDATNHDQIGSVKFLPADQMIELTFPQPLTAGKQQLRLSFRGKLNDKLVGFYRSSFKDGNGVSHNLAVTQFEPTDARRMFPCFDEPQLKAKFKLQIRAAKDLIAITNGALEKESIDAAGMKTSVFTETPPLSTYLVAVIVGPLAGTTPVVVGDVPIRVWSVAGKSALAVYARDEAAKLLPYYTNYFKISYPWKKLDLIAIPDFSAGAMENPGAITFRQTLLLVDEQKASASTKRAVTSVLAHEMAHLWFGDLVTMQWWDDLWLNEAFATFMSIHAVDNIHQPWQFWKQFASALQAALSTDALHATRAIHCPVDNPDQAHEMFDVITYEKGAAILRMLERYVGSDLFQEGIHQYLRAHAFANATTADLWSAISKTANKPVQAIMSSYVEQPGYPLIAITNNNTKHAWRQGSAANSHNSDNFSQRRYFSGGKTDGEKLLWSVPIGLRQLNGSAPQTEQSKPTRTILLKQPTSRGVLAPQRTYLANAGGTGYYRVHYPKGQLAALSHHASTDLDPSERLALLDDAWTLARSGVIPLEQYLDLLTDLQNQSDELVWKAIINQLDYLDGFVSDAARPAFQQLVRRELHHLQENLGWETRPGDDQNTRILRAAVLSTLGQLGKEAGVITKAKLLFQASNQKQIPLDPDLADAITNIVADNGGSPEYSTIQQLRKAAQTPEEEIRNLYALASFNQKELVQKTLTMSIDGSVRTQDAPHLLGNLLANRKTSKQAWLFVKANWTRIRSFYPEEMVPRLLTYASSFNEAADVADLSAFLKAHPIPSGKSAAARTMEKAKINWQFRQRSAHALNKWLLQHSGKIAY